MELVPDYDFARVEYHHGKCIYLEPMLRLGRRSDRITPTDSTWIVPNGPFMVVYSTPRVDCDNTEENDVRTR